jgi:hypothetical protein
MVGEWRWNKRMRLDDESMKAQDQILEVEGMDMNPMKGINGDIRQERLGVSINLRPGVCEQRRTNEK